MKRVGAFLLGIIVISGCGHNQSGELSPREPIGKIQIYGGVAADHRDRLAHAMSYLDDRGALIDTSALNIIDYDGAQTLRQWLEDRVHYIVSRDYDFNSGIYEVQSYFMYENPGVLPFIETPSQTLSAKISNNPQGEAKVLMSNIGTAIYYSGKSKGALLGLKISGLGNVPIFSPRAGVIQLGQGLFPKPSTPETSARDILLLATLFHEARHSDGNGKSSGFFHAVCPKGHDYAGLAACDRNNNGPYATEEALYGELIRTCTDCSYGSLEALKVMALDAHDRILPNSSAWDSRPEGQIR